MNTDAKNNPVRGAAKSLVSSDDVQVRQRPPIDLGEDRVPQAMIASQNDYGDGDELVAADNGEAAQRQQLENIKFMEQPVEIILQKSTEKFAPNVVDCWVNGRGAEQFVNGKWMVCGWLPVGSPVITKLKYVEVLARAKADSIQAKELKSQAEGQEEEQLTLRFTHTKYPFSILGDRSGGKAVQHISRILSEQ